MGLVAGGAAMLGGVIALLVVVPGLVWASRESSRPVGLGGLFVGMGLGGGGLILLSQGSCLRFTDLRGALSIHACSGGTDLTWYLVLAVGLLLAGLVVTFVQGSSTEN